MSSLWLGLMLPALAAGLLVVLMTGPLGCLVVWRRMAYFGDTLAHAGLLGAALALVSQLPLALMATLVGMIMALLLLVLARSNRLANDSLLGVLSHGSLALGLLAIWLVPTQVDLEALLFGDLLVVSGQRLVNLAIISGLTLAAVIWLWKPFLAITLSKDLAQAEGLAVQRYELAFMLLLAVTVAMGIQAVGVLLLTAMLIIPAASARSLANTPEQMAFGAVALGALAVVMGLAGSWWLDLPTGPAVVCASLLTFVILQLFQGIRSRFP